MTDRERDDVVLLLRDRDAQLKRVPLSFGADLRIRKALRDARPSLARPRLSVRLAVAVVTLVALGAPLAFALWPRHDAPAARLGAAGCSVLEHDGKSELVGHCTLRLGSITLESTREAAVVSRPNELAVLRGHVRVEVAPVPPKQPPVRVRVSGGLIEVVGTEFAITEDGAQGTVELFEGKIRFLAPGRAAIELAPGERFSWKASAAAAPVAAASEGAPLSVPEADPATSLPPPPKPSPPSPAAPASKISAPPRPGPHGVERAVERALELRAQGRYDEARAEIDAFEGGVEPRAAEALSYERASLLWRAGDRAAACAQWRAHVARFPQGSYHPFVSKHLSDRCSQPPAGN